MDHKFFCDTIEIQSRQLWTACQRMVKILSCRGGSYEMFVSRNTRPSSLELDPPRPQYISRGKPVPTSVLLRARRSGKALRKWGCGVQALARLRAPAVDLEVGSALLPDTAMDHKFRMVKIQGSYGPQVLL